MLLTKKLMTRRSHQSRGCLALSAGTGPARCVDAALTGCTSFNAGLHPLARSSALVALHAGVYASLEPLCLHAGCTSCADECRALPAACAPLSRRTNIVHFALPLISRISHLHIEKYIQMARPDEFTHARSQLETQSCKFRDHHRLKKS